MKTENLIPYILIFIAGAAVPLAVALNAILGRSLKSSLGSAAVVFAIGLVFLFLVMLFARSPLPKMEDINSVPWMAWTGGILIGFYMIVLILNAPKIGIGLSTSMVVFGQLVMGVAIDHFGLLGLPQQSFSVGRAAGIVAVMTGIGLLKFF